MFSTASIGKAAPAFPSISSAARRRPRVLLVTDSLDPSGVGEHMLTLATALRSHAQVAVLFADAPDAMAWVARARVAGLSTLVVPAADLSAGGPEFSATLDRYQPRIVHVHAGIAWEGHALAAAAHQAGVPAVIRTEHLPYTLWALKNPALEAAYVCGVQAVNRIICVCEAARRTFRMSGIDQARFTVVRNGIVPKLAQRSRAAVRAELGIGAERLVLTVARFTEQKRHATLLKALPAVLASCPDTRLAWVGAGPLEQELRACANRLGLTERILFLGRRNDVPDLIAASDLFCLPSFFEGHPLVVLEAMAGGLPVVATRSLGNTEAVRNGLTGLLVPVDCPPVLASALARVLNDRALAARLGAAGRAAIDHEFSAARMAHETLTIYRTVLAEGRNSAETKEGDG